LAPHVQTLPAGQVALGRLAAGAVALAVICAVTRQRRPREAAVWGHLAVVSVALPEERPTRARLTELVTGFTGVVLVLAPWTLHATQATHATQASEAARGAGSGFRSRLGGRAPAETLGGPIAGNELTGSFVRCMPSAAPISKAP
jgi:hypothetical protein